jgi:hypothetical protein
VGGDLGLVNGKIQCEGDDERVVSQCRLVTSLMLAVPDEDIRTMTSALTIVDASVVYDAGVL